MQEVKAQLKYLRISPKKVRLTTGILKGLTIKEAQAQLKNLNKKSSESILKLLNSAVANAEHNYGLKKEDLYISKILVDPGPSLKRYRPRARGSVFPISKRTSHVTIFLSSLKPQTPKTVESESKEKEVSKKEAETILEETKVETKQFEARPKSKVEKKIKKPIATKGQRQKIFRRKAI